MNSIVYKKCGRRADNIWSNLYERALSGDDGISVKISIADVAHNEDMSLFSATVNMELLKKNGFISDLTPHLIKSPHVYIFSENGDLPDLDKLDREVRDKLHSARSSLVYNKVGGNCFYCGKRMETDFVVEHYIPLCRGGFDVINNMVPSCRRCNGIKRAKPIEIFRYVLFKPEDDPLFNLEQIAYLENNGFFFEIREKFYYETVGYEMEEV